MTHAPGSSARIRRRLRGLLRLRGVLRALGGLDVLRQGGQLLLELLQRPEPQTRGSGNMDRIFRSLLATSLVS